MQQPTENQGSASLPTVSDSKETPTNPVPGPDPDPEDLQLNLPLTITIDSTGAQLSSQKNTKAELSEPRLIISESSRKHSLIQASLQRPILSGTYRDEPSYLMKLQLHLYTPGASRSWLTRIQTASVSVVLEDAPVQEDEDDDEESEDEDEEPMHPSIIRTFPGENGWEGPLHSALTTSSLSLTAQAGYDPFASISATQSTSTTLTKTSTVKIKLAIKGRRANILHVVMEENAVTRKGVPDFLVLPFVVRHWERRFKMKVSVSARYGFVRGVVAESWPILGRGDQPVFFEPGVMRGLGEGGGRDERGVRKVELVGVLDGVDLREYSSLKGEST